VGAVYALDPPRARRFTQWGGVQPGACTTIRTMDRGRPDHPAGRLAPVPEPVKEAAHALDVPGHNS